jgi:hypothetical protein
LYNKKENDALIQYQEIICIKVRHLALQNFRIFISDTINNVDKDQLKKNLITKILTDKEVTLSYDEIEKIVDEFMDKMFDSIEL